MRDLRIMKFEIKQEMLWQEDDNAQWYTNICPVCNLCNKKCETVIEFIDPKNNNSKFSACFHRDCYREAIKIIFGQNPELEHIKVRAITYRPYITKKESGISKKERDNQSLQSIRTELSVRSNK